MDAIKNLLNRKSSKNLEAPFPSREEMDIVYKSALRAPDHAWLRPSKFLEMMLSWTSLLPPAIVYALE